MGYFPQALKKFFLKITMNKSFNFFLEGISDQVSFVKVKLVKRSILNKFFNPSCIVGEMGGFHHHISIFLLVLKVIKITFTFFLT